MDRKLLKTVQTITTFRNRLADPVGTRRGPPLVRGPQFENRWLRPFKVDGIFWRTLYSAKIRMQM